MPSGLDEPDVLLKGVISNLYHLMVQAHDFEGPTTQQAMLSEVERFVQTLLDLSQAGKNVTVSIPIDLIEFVENARNPDIYSRQFVELAMKLNQELKGKSEAFGEFRDILGREMMSGIPDIKEDVRKIILTTNSHFEP